MWFRIFFVLNLVLFVNRSLAQDFSYYLHEVPLDLNSSTFGSSNDTSHTGMFIGSHHPGGVRTGFIYDHYGIIGPPGTTHDLPDLLGGSLPDEWTGSSCVGINDVGQVVGVFERTVDGVLKQRGYLLDLDLDLFSDDVPVPTWQYLPEPPGSTSSYGRRINNNGLVVIQAQPYAEYLFDSAVVSGEVDPQDALYPLVDPKTNEPINYPNSSRVASINDWGQVSGSANNPNGGHGYILTPATADQLAYIQWAPNQTRLARINSHGEWCGDRWSTVTTSKNRSTTVNNAVRFTLAKGYYETLSDEYSSLRFINDSGDAAGGFNKFDSKAHKPAVYHNERGWILLDGTLIKGDAEDLSLWSDPNTFRQVENMTNRNDATGFPDVVARATLTTTTTTTGKGKNAVTTNTTVRKYYYMEAQVP